MMSSDMVQGFALGMLYAARMNPSPAQGGSGVADSGEFSDVLAQATQRAAVGVARKPGPTDNDILPEGTPDTDALENALFSQAQQISGMLPYLSSMAALQGISGQTADSGMPGMPGGTAALPGGLGSLMSGDSGSKDAMMYNLLLGGDLSKVDANSLQKLTLASALPLNL